MGRDPDASEPLSDVAYRWMAGHLGEHGSDAALFDPIRDVHIKGSGGPWADAVFTYDPATGEVDCHLPDCPCPAWYPAGRREAGVAALEYALKARDPAYQPFLAGGLTRAERDRVIDLVDAGKPRGMLGARRGAHATEEGRAASGAHPSLRAGRV